MTDQETHNEIIDILQAEHLSEKYQSLLESISQQKLRYDIYFQDQSLPKIKQIHEQYIFSMQTLQQTLKKSSKKFVIEVLLARTLISRDQECIELHNALDLSSCKIDFVGEQIELLKQRVKTADEHVEELSSQLLESHQKLNAIDKQYEQQKKQTELDYIAEKTSQRKDIVELQNSNTNLSKILSLTKKEKSEQEESVNELSEKCSLLSHQLSNIEAKFQWEIQKKQQMEEQLIEKLETIENLQVEIDELRDILRNPFERLSPELSQMEMALHNHRKCSEQTHRKHSNDNESQAKGNFCEDAHEYRNEMVDYRDITGSFRRKLSDMGIKLESRQNDDPQGKSQRSFNENSNPENKLDSIMVDRKSILSKALSIRSIGRDSFSQNHAHKTALELIDDEKCHTVLQNRNSITAKKPVDLPPSQSNKSQLKSRITNYKKPIILDPYYSHFILTSQSVKIQEDQEDLLNIDMKPFYKVIIQNKIPMHLWDQWIRNKLKEILKKSQALTDNRQT